ncbi:hypothetical protein Tco_1010200 [Tanacetum coccineum]
MIDSLWKLNVADIEATISIVCQMVLQDPTDSLTASDREAESRGIMFKQRGGKFTFTFQIATIYPYEPPKVK